MIKKGFWSATQKSTILLSIAFLLSFVLITPVVNGQQISEENIQVEQLANDLEFLMEEAAIYDSQGNLLNFDFDKLEAEFGVIPELQILEKEIIKESLGVNNKSFGVIDTAAKVPFRTCMWSALKDHFGVTMINVAINGGLWKYVEKKAYKEAARLLIKIGIGGNLIGLTAMLTWYTAKCGLESLPKS